MKSRTKTIIALSIIPQILIVKLLSKYPNFVETYYSNGLYPILSKVMRYAFGWVPFSVGDVIYTIGVLYALRWLYINRQRIIKDTKNWLCDVGIALSLLYFTFHLFWGLNYYRLPIHKSIGIDNKYTTEELISTIDRFILKSNAIHSSISAHDSLKITMPYSKSELLTKSAEGYNKLETIFPNLNPAPKSVKRSLYSLPLTYMGFSGYLNPFTNEAQIDGLIPLHKFPSTSCHEQGHQIGYAAENETNFIGSLAAMNNDDPYLKYSGYIFALKHCLFELARRDVDAFEEKKKAINSGILLNYQEEREFWMSYENPLEPIFKLTFDTFLKANQQSQGIKSYSYVVALIVNYYKDKEI